jgi:hypothetical protein
MRPTTEVLARGAIGNDERRPASRCAVQGQLDGGERRERFFRRRRHVASEHVASGAQFVEVQTGALRNEAIANFVARQHSEHRHHLRVQLRELAELSGCYLDHFRARRRECESGRIGRVRLFERRAIGIELFAIRTLRAERILAREVGR